jgi:hypothetical protein
MCGDLPFENGTVVSASAPRRIAIKVPKRKGGDKRMALRILTGVIVPKKSKRNGGTAVVEFNPHKISGTDADVNKGELETAWASGDFRSRPGKIISMREFVV